MLIWQKYLWDFYREECLFLRRATLLIKCRPSCPKDNSHAHCHTRICLPQLTKFVRFLSRGWDKTISNELETRVRPGLKQGLREVRSRVRKLTMMGFLLCLLLLYCVCVRNCILWGWTVDLMPRKQLCFLKQKPMSSVVCGYFDVAH